MEPKNSTDSAGAATGTPRGRFIVWVAALAAVLALLLHQSLFEGRGLVSADGMLSFLPWQDFEGPGNILLADQFLVFEPQHEFVYQQFLEGHFPLWNPYIDCGVPNHASSQGALLFPINLLLLPVAPFYAAGIAGFLKLFLAGWFTMLYVRRLGVSPGGTFLAGLVFSLSGFMIVWLGHPHVNSAIWLPLFPYLIDRFFQGVRERTPVVRVGIVFAVAFGSMLMGGHPPTMIHVTLFTGVYFVFRWVQNRRDLTVKHFGLWIGAGMVGVLLAAPAVLPFLEYDHNSAEQFSSHGLQRSALHMPLNSLIFYLLPHISGSPPDGWQDTFLRLGVGDGLPNFNERTGYVGILPLLLALYAACTRRCPLVLFYTIVIVVSFLFVCGMPPLPVILTFLPVLHAVNPMRLMLVIGLGVAVLAGMGWDEFQRSENRRLKLCVVAGFWAAIGLVLFGYGLVVAPRWHVLEAGSRSFVTLQLLMLGGSLLVSCVLLARAVSPRLAANLALVWIVVDLLGFARGYNPEITHDRYYPSTPAVAWLQQHTGHARTLGETTELMPNVSEVFGLRDARGCDFTTVRRYEELVTGQTGDFKFYTYVDALPKPIQLLGVKYLLAFRAPNPDPAQFDEVYSNEISIFRYRPVRERAIVLHDYRVEHDSATSLESVRSGTFDPQRELLLEDDPKPGPAVARPPDAATNSSVQFISDQADTVSVQADLPQPGFLLLLDTYFPGWKATVNGQPTKIYRADYNFRAVQLPAGKSTVCFSYQPASFRIGIILCAIGLLVLGAMFLAPRRKV